jgi:hypothetical protein
MVFTGTCLTPFVPNGEAGCNFSLTALPTKC